jgi:hypothetical protein
LWDVNYREHIYNIYDYFLAPLRKESLPTYSEKNKKYWPIFPLHIGRYSLSNKPHTEKEVEALRELCLCTGRKKGHDPQNVIYEHIKVFKLA